MPGKLKFVTICIRCQGCHSRKTTEQQKKRDLSKSHHNTNNLTAEVENLNLNRVNSVYRVKMAATTRVILLACGSFNPITNMHLRMFEIARDHLHRTGRYQVIGGIISPVNDGYGKKDLVSSKHRAEMCKLAIQHNNWIKLDLWEAEQDTWSPTTQVLHYHQGNFINSRINNNLSYPKPLTCVSTASPTRRGLKRRRNDAKNESPSKGDIDKDDIYSSNSPVQVKLLCGGDLLESFAVPDLWSKEDMETIVGKYGLVVITRAGTDPYKFIYESDQLYKHQSNIHIVNEWIHNEISSTKIRRALRRNESVKYLLPDPVLRYIQSNGLYQAEDEEEKLKSGEKN
ncbi:nicotinamide/nicotinic acid mononucleotide adenylyltransferase 1-like isoform X2 [Apostichopus japonicus]|uniref:nicotinamide/nicotinic acid mononucleotide adenylyltransferase 1-like isoform X2 n=1 Tax=Stichopus japonicus TaxID=307972 RepID=UPI003AB84A67